MEKEIKVSLENLYDFLLNEKRNEVLQSLNPSFFLDVYNYLKEKNNLLENKKKESGFFSIQETERLKEELKSIKKIIKEIYERREKKIIEMAINKSRTNSDLIDTSNLLAEEKKFFFEIVSLLDNYRKGILLNLLDLNLPFVSLVDNSGEKTGEENEEKSLGEETSKEKEEKEEKEEKKAVKIKIIHPVPSFVGKNLELYGPYEENEIIDLPEELANVLIEKKRAERI